MKKIAIKIIIVVLASIIFTTIGFLLVINFINLRTYNDLSKVKTFSDYINLSKHNVIRNSNFFIIFTLVLFLILSGAFVYFVFFRKRKEQTDESKYWLWNDKFLVGDRSFFKKQFLVSPDYKHNQNNANWVINYANSLKKWWINNGKNDINSVVIGGVGSGKTQRVILPNILYNRHLRLKYKSSFVITDPKKEIIKAVGKKLTDQNYKIFAIDFSEPEYSNGWNPLHYVYKQAHLECNDQKAHIENIYKAFSEINNVIEQLPWSDTDEKFWTDNAKRVINTATKFLLLVSIERPDLVSAQDFNLISVGKLCVAPAWDANQDWISIVKLRADDDLIWKELWFEVEALLSEAKNAQTFQSILSFVSSALAIFTNDEFVQRVIAQTKSFDLNLVAKEKQPVAIFIHSPDHKPSHHFLISMLIDQIYQALVNQANENGKRKDEYGIYLSEKLDRKWLFLLDEAGNLPKIINLDNKVTISRSRNIFFQFVLQDYNQLKKYNDKVDGVDKTIRSNLQFTYFLNSNDEDTLKELSESLGKKEVKKISKSTSYDSRSKGSTSGTTENIEEKPLMSVSEIKSKNKDLAIVSIIGYKPMLIKTKLAYKHFINDNYVHQCDETSSEIVKWNLSNLTHNEAQESVSVEIEQSENIDKETEINEETKQENDLYSIALDIVNKFE